MKSLRFAPLCTLLILILPVSLRPQSNLTPVANGASAASSANDFRNELRRVEYSLRATPPTPEAISALERSLPGSWNVSTPDGAYQVSSAPLRNLLAAAARDSSTRSVRLAQAQQWLAELESETLSYDSPNEVPDSQARGKLNSILSAREFNQVHKTSASDWLKEKIWNWLTRLFDSISIRMTKHPLGERAFFWLLLLGLVTWLAFALFRFWAHRSRLEDLKPPRTFARSRTWQEWLRTAREAAARRDFREAVHSAYWGAIAHLEDVELVPADRARTPREYVRLYSAPRDVQLAPSTGQQESLAAITARLERTWYGRASAGPSDFQDSLREVEALGCQLR
jgi:uncharacterized protein DUF4129